MDAPEWIRSFNGSRIVVQDEAKDIVWTDDAAQAAQSVQQLAEGQEIQQQKTGTFPLDDRCVYLCRFVCVELLFICLSLGIFTGCRII